MPPKTLSAPRRCLSRRLCNLCYFGFAGFVVFLAVVRIARPTAAALNAPTAPQATGPAVVAADTASPLDEPLRLIGEAHKVFEDVKDYSCVLIKRERIDGKLSPNHVISMKVRNEPFSVYMKWGEPSDLAGQEVAYMAAKHGSKMRVHLTGALGLVGWMSIDQKDPRAAKSSRHTIAEAGLGNIIERYTKGWEAERPLGLTSAKLASYEYNKRPCVRVETTHRPDTAGQFEYYRTVVFFDKESKLPIRVECYEYPRDGSDTAEMVECYSYVNLRYNVGHGDELFNR